MESRKSKSIVLARKELIEGLQAPAAPISGPQPLNIFEGSKVDDITDKKLDELDTLGELQCEPVVVALIELNRSDMYEVEMVQRLFNEARAEDSGKVAFTGGRTKSITPLRVFALDPMTQAREALADSFKKAQKLKEDLLKNAFKLESIARNPFKPIKHPEDRYFIYMEEVLKGPKTEVSEDQSQEEGLVIMSKFLKSVPNSPFSLAKQPAFFVQRQARVVVEQGCFDKYREEIVDRIVEASSKARREQTDLPEVKKLKAA
jgi:hypothetical protein